MTERLTNLVEVTTFRAGYGHIRGALAVYDRLKELGLSAVRLVNLGEEGNWGLRNYLKILNLGLGFCYHYFPDLFIKVSKKVGNKGMEIINRLALMFYRDAVKKNNQEDLTPSMKKINIASHMIAAGLTPMTPTFLLVLDPFPDLYNVAGSNVCSLTPDFPTAETLKQYGGERKLVVTGPFVAKPIEEARGRVEARISELKNGSGLKITIATGGSLTHSDEIVVLTKAYVEQMKKGAAIEKIFVVVGDSKKIREELGKILEGEDDQIKERVEIIYDEDPIKLVRKADWAMGESDIIHAKTGELVYTVSGGKVFEAFPKNPSLGPQEIALREYVEKKTTDNNGICALEIGEKDPNLEVLKILEQLKNGSLFQRMRNGLKIPANGAFYAAVLIKNYILQEQLMDEQP